jgi:hypothetical protein
MTGFELGRLQEAEKSQPVLHDAPEKQMAAVMSKLDEMIEAMKLLAAKLDADAGDTGGDNDYAALITDALGKIELKL